MEIHISNSSLIEAIETISQCLDLSCEVECEEAVVNIPDQLGRGWIKGINFQNGLGLFFLDIKLKKSLTLKYKLTEIYPVRVLFCKEGWFTYAFENHRPEYTMEPLRSAISASSDDKDQSLIFPANTSIILTILEIDRKTYVKRMDCDLDSVPEPLANVFRDHEAEDPFLYTGDYSLSISEVVNDIHTNNYHGVVRKAYLESKALELFSLIVRQYKDDLNPDIQKVVIRKSDLEKIEVAREILTLDLAKGITIPELARQVGLNENKLKRGFKQAYNSTVNQFLINKRLEYARVLLLSGSFSIQEVAEKVGYKNVGYFTRRFKERYGILPKDFVKNSKVNMKAS
ncbi:helix-turn-helix domain-containing protein [Nafulsella turpanensis]|uniref:helix-turn-helix domain-containing protein n=1 Tax=Nafulsella turpanensis TaxID=1265690 RepID=UPI000345ED36|nr:AraC family transcriptional regulator [Nafulsella turpanensis]